MAPNALHQLANITDEELAHKAVQLRQRFVREYDPKGPDAFEPEDVRRLMEDDGYCQRFVAHQRNNVDKALEMVKDVFKWRRDFGVKAIRESSFTRSSFESKTVYPHKTDKDGNPVLMLKVCAHRKDPDSPEQAKRFLVFWLEQIERLHRNPLLVCIFDFAGAGVANVDVEQTMFVISCFLRHYPYLVALWKMAKTLLPRSSKDKIIFVDKETILNYIASESLPVSMGGQCKYNGLKEIDEYREQLKKQMLLIRYTNVPEKEEKKNFGNPGKKKASLEVVPSEKLEFPYEGETVKSKVSLLLKNVSRQSLGFKIRGNNIEAYKVKPFTGFLEPNCSQTITVELVDALDEEQRRQIESFSRTLKNLGDSRWLTRKSSIQAVLQNLSALVVAPPRNLDGQSCLPKDKLLVQWVPVENKVTKVQSFNALWRAAPKSIKEEHMLQCCKLSKSRTSSLKKAQTANPGLTQPRTNHPADKQTIQKLNELDRSVRGLQFQNNVLRLSLFLLTLGLLPVAWLLYEVVDLLRLQPGGLCDRTIRDSLLASFLCRADRTILPAHMM